MRAVLAAAAVACLGGWFCRIAAAAPATIANSTALPAANASPLAAPAATATSASAPSFSPSRGPITTDLPSSGAGIVERALPPSGYFQHIRTLYDGDYRSALDAFNLANSLGLATQLGRWVDSICYRTMIGECYYKMGRFETALENYDAAIKLYIGSPNWMLGIEYPPRMPAPTARFATPWGRSSRPTQLCRLPTTVAVTSDQNLFDPAIIRGNGTVPNPGQTLPGTLLPQGTPLSISVQEVARCMALALKRRHELAGAICPHDPQSDSVLTSLSLRLDRNESSPARVDAFTSGDPAWKQRLATPDPYSQVWVDAELGFAYLGTGQVAEAVKHLKHAVSLPGNLDHPLTPLVLLELGQLALESRDYKSAENLLAEASYSGYDYGDLGVIEEAFYYGHQAYLQAEANPPEMFPPLATAIPWSATHGHELHASLLLLAAEDEARLKRTAQAAAAVAQAKATLYRRDAASGDTGARLDWVAAGVDYQQNHVSAGDQSVAAALDYEKSGSKWLFQLHLLDKDVADHTDSTLTRQWALPIYASLLRDPAADDWSSEPLESLAVLAEPLQKSYENWFDAALKVGPDLSLEVADRARRHRFLSSLPLGGRLMALRWVLEAPADSLEPAILSQRKELLTRHPRYAKLAKAARAVQADLAAMPLARAPGMVNADDKLSDKLNQLAKLSAEQETLLREMAVSREAADIVFPPLRKMKDIQGSLLPRQYMLVFFAAHGDLYAWLMSNSRCAEWKIQSAPQLEKKIATLLRAIGNSDANSELPRKKLADETWKNASRDVLGALVAGSKVNLGGSIDELTIVPDGALWYLPFEALVPGGAKANDAAAPLLEKSRIRYLPTMGLAIPGRADRGSGEMGVVLGKLHPRDDPESTAAELQRLSKSVAHVSALIKPPPASSPLYASQFNSLLVLDDLSINENALVGNDHGFYGAWSPIQSDRMRSSGTLQRWFVLPWKHPSQVLLPGFHTPAENSLRHLGSAGAGDDLFFAICGLMSTGARTVLISRWRVGGQSSGELLRQFAQELPYTSASGAWQRSVQILWQTPLDLDREPRIGRTGDFVEASGVHPLFWAGYLLSDTGWTPPKAEKLAAGK